MGVQPRTAVVKIYQGDYIDRIRHLERRAEAARDASDPEPKRMGIVPDYVALATEHDGLVAEAEESAITVKVRALKRGEWKALVAKHPPRKDHDEDTAASVNEETFKEVLVPASILEPEGFVGDGLDDLSDIDFDRCYITAFLLNRAPASDPKANLVSRMTQPNDET
jgi:hypothetical protein